MGLAFYSLLYYVSRYIFRSLCYYDISNENLSVAKSFSGRKQDKVYLSRATVGISHDISQQTFNMVMRVLGIWKDYKSVGNEGKPKHTITNKQINKQKHNIQTRNTTHKTHAHLRALPLRFKNLHPSRKLTRFVSAAQPRILFLRDINSKCGFSAVFSSFFYLLLA